MIVYNAPFFFLETTGTSYIMRLTDEGPASARLLWKEGPA